MRSAYEAARADELRRAAHTLKSNARTFGAGSLAELCERLETKARSGELDETAELVADIERSYSRVEEALAARRLEGSE
jgi:two-component system sensor histidine kinase/response regulator